MKIRPYLTYPGNCQEAIDLYLKAFNTQPIQIMRFGEMQGGAVPEEMNDWILQCTLKFGDDFIRMSDCSEKLNDPESERISLAVECPIVEVQHAFAILAKEGRIGTPLAETFYSPCAGVVFDKFGVMWNFVAQEN